MATTIRVGVRPHVYQGIPGWRVRWYDGDRYRSYFVQTREAAKALKARVKEGRSFGSRWAVAC